MLGRRRYSGQKSEKEDNYSKIGIGMLSIMRTLREKGERYKCKGRKWNKTNERADCECQVMKLMKLW